MSFWVILEWSAMAWLAVNLWLAAGSRDDKGLRQYLVLAGANVLLMLVAEVCQRVL